MNVQHSMKGVFSIAVLRVALGAAGLISPAVQATPTDGTYTGTASVQYSTTSCSPPGVDSGGIVPVPAVDVTLIVENNATVVTLKFDKSGVLTVVGAGSSTGSNLNLNFNNLSDPGRTVNIQAQITGNSVSDFPSNPSVAQNANQVTMGPAMISGQTQNCGGLSVNFDWPTLNLSLSTDAFNEETTGNVIASKVGVERNTVLASNQVGAIGRLGLSETQTQGSAENGLTPIAGGLRIRSRSAGDGWDYGYGFWASFQHSDFEDDFAVTAFTADTDMVLVGADISPRDDVVFGVALGYETTDANTTFNGGELESDGLIVVPYLAGLADIGLLFLAVDASVGFTRLDIDQFRTDPATGARVTNSADSNRVFFSGNVSTGKSYGNWYVSGRAGILIASEDTDGFTESDGTAVADNRTRLGRFLLGGDVAYTWNSFEPFASVVYEKDYDFDKIVTATSRSPPMTTATLWWG